jgi:hypothetical protein
MGGDGIEPPTSCYSGRRSIARYAADLVGRAYPRRLGALRHEVTRMRDMRGMWDTCGGCATSVTSAS